MRKILFCMIALCLCACDSAEKNKSAKETPTEQTTANEEAEDKYVYIDDVEVLHVKKSCVKHLPLMYENVSEKGTIFIHGINYIKKTN